MAEAADAPEVDPRIARWTASSLTFPLRRTSMARMGLGMAAFAAACALMVATPGTAARLTGGARVSLAACAIVAAGICGYATVVLVRNRAVLLVDRSGVHRGSKAIAWDRLSTIGLDSSEVKGTRIRELVIGARSGRAIRVNDRLLCCSAEEARVLIRRWGIEHVDPTLFGGIVDPGRHEAMGAAVLDEVARSMGPHDAPGVATPDRNGSARRGTS